MLSEDFSLQFDGFSPSEEVVRKIRIALSDLYLLAPHRSFLKATFRSLNETFVGEIDIISQVGKFKVSLDGKDFESLTQSAIEKIRWQLDSWKATRFI